MRLPSGWPLVPLGRHGSFFDFITGAPLQSDTWNQQLFSISLLQILTRFVLRLVLVDSLCNRVNTCIESLDRDPLAVMDD